MACTLCKAQNFAFFCDSTVLCTEAKEQQVDYLLLYPTWNRGIFAIFMHIDSNSGNAGRQ